MRGGKQRENSSDGGCGNGKNPEYFLETVFVLHEIRLFSDIQKLWTRFINKYQNSSGNQSLYKADGEMNRLHGCDKCEERQFRHAGGYRFQRNTERTELQGEYTSQNRGNDNFLFGHAVFHHQTPNEQSADKASVKGHVPYIASKREQSAVGKQQTLDEQHADHCQKARAGTEQGRQHHAAAQVPAGTGSRNRKIYHLGSKYKRSHNSHHRNFFRVGFHSHLFDRVSCCGARAQIHRAGNSRRD